MQQDLFGNMTKPTEPSQDEISLVLSKTNSSKSKAKTDFQNALQKNKQLQLKCDYLNKMVLFSTEKIHEVLTKIELEHEQTLLHQIQKLDGCYENRLFKFTKKRKEKLGEIIFEKAVEVYSDLEMKEAEEYFNKYKPAFMDDELVNSKEAIQEGIKNLFGLDIDLDDFDGGVDFEKLNEKYAHQFENMNDYMDDHFHSFDSQRKKTKKQIAQEEKRKADEKLLESDVQKIFKELVLKLHPDKEMDEAIKLEKEELLKLVTRARDEDDIYELLRIRMLVSENDATIQELVLNDDTLKRLTKLIREKNRMIEFKIYEMQEDSVVLRQMPGIQMDETKMKKLIIQIINNQKSRVIDMTKLAKLETERITKDNKSLNDYISHYQLDYEMYDDDDDFLPF